MFKANLSLPAILLVIFAVSMVGAEDALDGKTLATIRFENGPESYAGKPYYWLADAQIDLTMDVKPAANLALDLLWGTKNDTRRAVVVVNGKPVVSAAAARSRSPRHGKGRAGSPAQEEAPEGVGRPQKGSQEAQDSPESHRTATG